MIQHVEELRTELQLLAFHDTEILKQRCVDIDLSRRADDIPSGVAKGAKGGVRKGGWVEPIACTLVRRNQRYAEHAVGTAVVGGAVTEAVATDSARRACVDRLDALQFPAANNEISQPAHSTPKLLSFADWNIVAQAVDEPVCDIEIRA